MPKLCELTGRTYGDLTVLYRIPYTGSNPKYSVRWKCACACGKNIECRTNYLITGKTTHCGCKYVRGTHNRSHTKEYNSWRHIKSRCINPENAAYHKYGGRGITMCDRWLNSFQNFLDDMGYAPENSQRYSVERKDNDGPYEPGNCHWATPDEQANNRRTSRLITYKGETKTL